MEVSSGVMMHKHTELAVGSEQHALRTKNNQSSYIQGGGVGVVGRISNGFLFLFHKSRLSIRGKMPETSIGSTSTINMRSREADR